LLNNLLEYAYAILLWSSINSVCAGANIMNSGQSTQLFYYILLTKEAMIVID